jgi:hypothetical protein
LTLAGTALPASLARPTVPFVTRLHNLDYLSRKWKEISMLVLATALVPAVGVLSFVTVIRLGWRRGKSLSEP